MYQSFLNFGKKEHYYGQRQMLPASVVGCKLLFIMVMVIGISSLLCTRDHKNPSDAKVETKYAPGEGAVFIASIPPVADVYMDEEFIGKTNVSQLNITSGTHAMRFVKDEKRFDTTMTFKEGRNPSVLVKFTSK